jgi:hypothetical protein
MSAYSSAQASAPAPASASADVQRVRVAFREMLLQFADKRKTQSQSRGQLHRQQQEVYQPKTVVFQRDRSGSTNSVMRGGLRIIDKIGQAMMTEILKEPRDNYFCIDFNDGVSAICKIPVIPDEMFADIPEAVPSGTTHTDRAFVKAKEGLKLVRNPKDLRIILVTDGETNSTTQEIQASVAEFKKLDVRIDVIAVSNSNKDMNSMGLAEQRKVPGMDIIEMLGNAVSTLSVYNLVHWDKPFLSVEASSVDKHHLKFMGISVDCSIPTFIQDFLTFLTTQEITWGAGDADFKSLVVEIGKILSLMWSEFPERHPFVSEVIVRLQQINQTMTVERIKTFIVYGFERTRQKLPINLANIEEYAKDAAVKKAQIGDANTLLNTKGTTCGSEGTLVGFGKDVVVMAQGTNADELELTFPLGAFPNSRNENGVTFFSPLSAHGQGTRIGLRALCANYGYKDAQRSPNVIFHVAKLMSDLFMQGTELNSPIMSELQKLAVIQCSMEIMIAHGKYSGIPLVEMWQKGVLPQMHFSNKATHASLHTDPSINPLKLTEFLWWAKMMAMLGTECFQGQINFYKHAIKATGIPISQEFMSDALSPQSFAEECSTVRVQYLEFLRANYPCRTFVKTIVITPEPQSVITLEKFPSGEAVFILSDHVNPDSRELCKCNTHYSASEMESFLRGEIQRCVWCKYVPQRADFVPVQPIVSVKEQMRVGLQQERASPAEFRPSSVASIFQPPCAKCGTVHSERCQMSAASGAGSASAVAGYRKVIFLQGTVGCGKSTIAEKLKAKIATRGGKCIVISSDQWKKQGMSDVDNIQREMREFENDPNPIKVIVVDICNDTGVSPYIFGLDLTSYNSVTVRPNIPVNPTPQQVSDYAEWTLTNVLNRPMHSKDSPYWLNPASASVKTCVSVHMKKMNGFMAQIGVNTKLRGVNVGMPIPRIVEYLRSGADRHTAWLATQSMDAEIDNILADMP